MSSKKNVQNQTTIKSFVFFDLETNELIQKSCMPEITELSLVATSRKSLFKGKRLPRILHKLTIPLRPMQEIPPIVSALTGLDKDLLKIEKPFDDEVYNLLKSFIGRLRPPVCFVAHNGNGFDYLVLLAELSRIGKTLSEDIFCVDSLQAFPVLPPFTRKRPVNFKLGTVYKYLVGTAPLDAHSAEADCITLLTCVMRVCNSFVPWADRCAISLVDPAKERR